MWRLETSPFWGFLGIKLGMLESYLATLRSKRGDVKWLSSVNLGHAFHFYPQNVQKRSPREFRKAQNDGDYVAVRLENYPRGRLIFQVKAGKFFFLLRRWKTWQIHIKSACVNEFSSQQGKKHYRLESLEQVLDRRNLRRPWDTWVHD